MTEEEIEEVFMCLSYSYRPAEDYEMLESNN